MVWRSWLASTKADFLSVFGSSIVNSSPPKREIKSVARECSESCLAIRVISLRNSLKNFCSLSTFNWSPVFVQTWKMLSAFDRQTPVAQTCHYWNDHWPTQEYLPDRAFTPSESNKLPGQSYLWLDRLLSSAQETFSRFRYIACSHRLTRIHVILLCAA